MLGRRVLGRERHVGGGSAALAEIDAIAQRTPDVEVDLRSVGVQCEGAEDVARPRGLDGSGDPGGLEGRLDRGILRVDDQVAAGAGVGQRAERRDRIRPGQEAADTLRAAAPRTRLRSAWLPNCAYASLVR